MIRRIAKTDYVVKQFEGNDKQGYHEKGDLYQSGKYVGNIYLRSASKNNDSAPLHPKQTCYLWLSYSDDDGMTWSEPVDITPQVKEDWMRFCGVGCLDSEFSFGMMKSIREDLYSRFIIRLPEAV